jgi:methionyl-tRNA formyltransferase
MRVVFMGYQTWGRVTLEAVLRAGHEVPLVVTHPPSGHEYETIWADSVRGLAESRGIPVIECRRACPVQVGGAVRDARADVILSSDWRSWLDPRIYDLAPHGALNIHDAPLPRYAGFAPINWAILNGETETAVTVHWMNEHFDLGDILIQERVPIGPDDTATDVFHRTLPLFDTLAVRALELLEAGDPPRAAQDPAQATFFHKRCERDSLIDWREPRARVRNLVRAQSDPYPNAFTFHQGKKVRIKRASLAAAPFRGSPGRVFARGPEGVVVLAGACAEDPGQGLLLEVVQPEGGEELHASDYFTRAGDYLGVHP